MQLFHSYTFVWSEYHVLNTTTLYSSPFTIIAITSLSLDSQNTEHSLSPYNPHSLRTCNNFRNAMNIPNPSPCHPHSASSSSSSPPPLSNTPTLAARSSMGGSLLNARTSAYSSPWRRASTPGVNTNRVCI